MLQSNKVLQQLLRLIETLYKYNPLHSEQKFDLNIISFHFKIHVKKFNCLHVKFY